MSTLPSEDSSEPDERSDHKNTAGSTANITAAVSTTDNSDLLAVLRDLASTVKRLEAHVIASSNASLLDDAASEKPQDPIRIEGNRPKDSIPRKFITSSCPMVRPEEWHPLVNNITFKELARVKARLLLPDMDQDDFYQLSSPLGLRTQRNMAREVESLFPTEDIEISADQLLKFVWHPEDRLEEYKISSEELACVEIANWFPYRSIHEMPIYFINPGASTTFPELVSHADWSYYRPTYERIINIKPGLVGVAQAMGRNNFIGAWQFPSPTRYRSATLKTDVEYNPEDTESLWLPVPYPSIPPEYSSHGTQRLWPFQPFSEGRIADLNNCLGCLWTIPLDERLDLHFQRHVLVVGDKLDLLRALRGSLEITEFDDKKSQYTYRPFKCASAADAEEWFLEIPPKLIKVSPDGYPIGGGSSGDVDPGQMNHWKRTVRIRDLASVDTPRMWQPVKRFYTANGAEKEKRDNMLFEIHTGCSLKANERLQNDKHASIFHFCWMELEEERNETVHYPRWAREQVHGSNVTLGTVAASVEYFGSRRHHPTQKYWTILALLPRSLPVQNKEIPTTTQGCFWGAIIQIIKECLETATQSWGEIAAYMEQLLTSGDTKQIIFEDKHFSQSTKLFWIISKIDQILPMISDATAQWAWFVRGNDLFQEPSSAPLIPFKDGGLPDSEKLEPILVQIRRLNDCKAEFEELRERARSFRDGIFSLTSVKEARESRVLAENVKLLTYVTILYLPLAFCTSMWAINDMFGTGTRGFAIITTLISCGTYAIVFGLHHPPSRLRTLDILKMLSGPLLLYYKDCKLETIARAYLLHEAMKQSTRRNPTENAAEEENIQSIARSLEIAGKEKGKEKVMDEDKSHPVQDPQTTAKPSILARFRRAKARMGDHEQEVSGA